MKKGYLLELSLKNLMANKLRTFLTLGGVIIGIGAIVFLVSLGYGLQRVITSQIASMEEMKMFDVVTGDSEIVKMNDKTISDIGRFGKVKKAAPMINIATKMHYGDSAVGGVIYGINKEYKEMARIEPERGEEFSSWQAREIIINKSALDLLGVNQEEYDDIIGKKISLDYIVTADLRPEGKKKLSSEGNQVKVVGIDNNDESPFVYMPIDNLRKEGVVNYSKLKVKTNSVDDIKKLRKQVEDLGYKTEYIGDTVSRIEEVFNVLRFILAAFGGIAMIVAGLGMFNTLTISLLERTREIGLLKAIGMKKNDIQTLFLFEALILGITGGIFGLFVGYFMGVLLNGTMNVLASVADASAVNFFYTPWIFSLEMLGFSILVGIFTGLYPARRAMWINALDALRYE